MQPGEFLAVTGQSGSGKSTFMHIAGCLDKPTSGQYFLDGEDVSRMSKDQLASVRNKKIGFVFQGFNLLSRTTALDNVELPLLYGGSALKAAARHKRAMEVLTAVGLDKRADHHPNQLSGGQQQRVAIARSLINNPSILLADEPTGNLDTRTSIEVMDIFQRLNTERGITVLLITHEQDIAEYGTRIVQFRDGQVVADRPVATRRDARRRTGGAACSRGSMSNRPAGLTMAGVIMAVLMIFRIALKALGRNKMRTALTMLGMIIGVAAVITMVALGTGAQSSIDAQIQTAGHQHHPGHRPATSRRAACGRARATPARSRPDDANGDQRRCRACSTRRRSQNTRGQMVAGNQNWNTQLQGTDIDYPLINAWQVQDRARFFTAQDVTTAAKVVVIGTVVRDQLFGPDADPIGQIIRIQQQPFTVVGVMRVEGPVGQRPGSGRRARSRRTRR